MKSVQKFREIAKNSNQAKIFNRPVVVLYVIGGLTYGEVGCLRKVANENGVELLICVTKMINYKDMVNAFEMGND